MEKDPIQNLKNVPDLLFPANNFHKGKVDEDKAKKACRQFESLFWQEIFKMMRKMTWGKERENFSASGNEIYQTFLEQEISRILAQKQRIGIGDLIYKQITRQQKIKK